MRILLPAIAALATLAPVHAQAPGGAKVRFLAERTSSKIAEVEMLSEETRSGAFELPTNHLSQPLDAPARAFQLVPAGKDTPLAKIALPAEGKAFIVLLVPGAEGYEPVVIADKNPDFRPGDVYFHNHARKKILGFVGKSRFSLAPGKGRFVRPTGARDEGFYDVGFGVVEKEGNRTLSTSRWPVEERMRTYVFFFVNPTTKRTDFRAVDEFVPAATP